MRAGHVPGARRIIIQKKKTLVATGCGCAVRVRVFEGGGRGNGSKTRIRRVRKKGKRIFTRNLFYVFAIILRQTLYSRTNTFAGDIFRFFFFNLPKSYSNEMSFLQHKIDAVRLRFQSVFLASRWLRRMPDVPGGILRPFCNWAPKT